MKSAKQKVDRDQIHKLINTRRIEVWKDGKWAYPQMGDSQGTCPMLDLMFSFEYKPATVIVIFDQPKPKKPIKAISKGDMKK